MPERQTIVVLHHTSKMKHIDTINCDLRCGVNCLKPKKKCCKKYKKKGINCKRCPKILLRKAS